MGIQDTRQVPVILRTLLQCTFFLRILCLYVTKMLCWLAICVCALKFFTIRLIVSQLWSMELVEECFSTARLSCIIHTADVGLKLNSKQTKMETNFSNCFTSLSLLTPFHSPSSCFPQLIFELNYKDGFYRCSLACQIIFHNWSDPSPPYLAQNYGKF